MSVFDKVGTIADWNALPLETRVYLSNAYTAGPLNFIDPWARCDVWSLLTEEQRAAAQVEMEIAGNLMRELLKTVGLMYGLTPDNQAELTRTTYDEDARRIEESRRKSRTL